MTFELDGNEYVPDKDSLTMIHDGRTIECYGRRFSRSKIIICVATGSGVLIIVVVISVVVSITPRGRTLVRQSLVKWSL